MKNKRNLQTSIKWIEILLTLNGQLPVGLRSTSSWKTSAFYIAIFVSYYVVLIAGLVVSSTENNGVSANLYPSEIKQIMKYVYYGIFYGCIFHIFLRSIFKRHRCKEIVQSLLDIEIVFNKNSFNLDFSKIDRFLKLSIVIILLFQVVYLVVFFFFLNHKSTFALLIWTLMTKIYIWCHVLFHVTVMYIIRVFQQRINSVRFQCFLITK